MLTTTNPFNDAMYEALVRDKEFGANACPVCGLYGCGGHK